MSYSIGVDLGGTNIKIVVITNDGEVLEYLTCDTADSTLGEKAGAIGAAYYGIQEAKG